MKTAHGGVYAQASAPIAPKHARKRGRVRQCAVGRDTAFAYVLRYRGRDKDRLAIGKPALAALRQLRASFVETTPVLAGGGKWLDAWRIPVHGHTPQSLLARLRAVGIDGPHYGRGREIEPGRVVRRPGDHGYTERHLAPGARRRAARAALDRLLRAKGDIPELLLTLGVTLSEVRKQEIIPLKYVPKVWGYSLDSWRAMADRQPDFPRLFRLMIGRDNAAMSAYNAARRAFRAARDAYRQARGKRLPYAALREAMGAARDGRIKAYYAARLAAQRAQIFREWIESQPPVKQELTPRKPKAPDKPLPRITPEMRQDAVAGDKARLAAYGRERSQLHGIPLEAPPPGAEAAPRLADSCPD